VRFWDASAIIPLVLAETSSTTQLAILATDEALAVWWGTRIECNSAIARRVREGEVAGSALPQVRQLLGRLLTRADELRPSEELRMRAERLLDIHPLRAADSLQLAAGLLWAQERPAGREFVCLDGRLREAARREGFSIIPT